MRNRVKTQKLTCPRKGEATSLAGRNRTSDFFLIIERDDMYE
jgi:hypothetical protein